MGERVRKLLLLAAWGALLSSCASGDNVENRNKGDNVSTIPWDHPEKWESGSGMPGINSNPGGY